MSGRVALSGLAATAGLLAASCTATSPEFNEQVLEQVKDIPAEYAASSPPGEVDQRWLSRFKDKQLTGLVNEVEANNPDLRIAAIRIDKALANAYLAGADARPGIESNFNGNRQKQNFIGFPVGDPGGPDSGGGGESGEAFSNFFNTFGVSLAVNWELDLWGRVREGVSAALADVDAEVANQKAMRISLAAQTAKAYFALKEAEEQVTIAEETKGSFEKTVVTFVDAALERGEQPVFQARLAKTDVATAEASLREREQVRDEAKRQLEALLGRYPSGGISASIGLPDPPATPPAGLPSSLLRRRPDLIAAERQVAAADKRILEAKLALLPRLALTSSLGTSSEDLKNVLNKDFSVYSLGFDLIQTVYAQGQVRGNVWLRNANLEEALVNYEKVALNAFKEVESALDAGTHLARRSESVRKALALAENAYDSARKDYADGNVDALTLLAAQRQWLNLRAQQVTLRGLRLANRIDLHLALGGDYKARD